MREKFFLSSTRLLLLLFLYCLKGKKINAATYNVNNKQQMWKDTYIVVLTHLSQPSCPYIIIKEELNIISVEREPVYHVITRAAVTATVSMLSRQPLFTRTHIVHASCCSFGVCTVSKREQFQWQHSLSKLKFMVIMIKRSN